MSLAVLMILVVTRDSHYVTMTVVNSFAKSALEASSDDGVIKPESASSAERRK